eukprot:jgi/Ulvmu1/1484/UM011_0214.1
MPLECIASLPPTRARTHQSARTSVRSLRYACAGGKSCAKSQAVLSMRNVVAPVAIVNGCCVTLARVLFYICTVWKPWGLAGAALAFDLANIANLVVRVIWNCV